MKKISFIVLLLTAPMLFLASCVDGVITPPVIVDPDTGNAVISPETAVPGETFVVDITDPVTGPLSLSFADGESFTGEMEVNIPAGSSVTTLFVDLPGADVVIRVLSTGGMLDDSNITVAPGTTPSFHWAVTDADALTAQLGNASPYNNGVILTEDFTTDALPSGNGQFWIPESNDGYVFDGNGQTITANSEDANSGGKNVLVAIAPNVVIKNLTIESTVGQKTNGMIIYGDAAKNVIIENVTITGFAHAGIIISGAEVTATNLNISGNGWGGINIAKGTGLVNVVSTLTLVSGSLTDTYPVYVDLTETGANTGTDYVVNLPTGWELFRAANDAAVTDGELTDTPTKYQEFYYLGTKPAPPAGMTEVTVY